MHHCHNPTQLNPKLGRPYFPMVKPNQTKPKPTPTFSQLLHNQTRPNSVCNFISTSTRRFMHRTIISFVQPQPNSIQNKNNLISCGTAPGNLVFSFKGLLYIKTKFPGTVQQRIGLFLFCIILY